jgi:N-acetylglutamate synthase-like GNAT family acetyltransferase
VSRAAVGLTLRRATVADTDAIARLIAESSRSLLLPYYSAAQIEAALGGTFGVDRSLIEDGTYFVAEEDGRLAGCGGWGKRARVFGASGGEAEPPAALDPATEPARIRAFFVAPEYARRGVGRLILARCEAEARAHGFRAATLMATLGGIDFYRRAGYMDEAPVRHDMGGVFIDFLRMGKSLIS